MNAGQIDVRAESLTSAGGSPARVAEEVAGAVTRLEAAVTAVTAWAPSAALRARKPSTSSPAPCATGRAGAR